MTRLVVDADLRQKLFGLNEPLELFDESGKFVGRLFPAVDLSQYEPWEPPMDEAELLRRERSDKWHTTAQVLAHLDGIEKG